MEPAPATRAMSRLQCAGEALFQCGLSLGCLFYALNPPHWAFLTRWAFTLLTLSAICIGLQRTFHWLLLSRHMGQTVTYRIGPRGHTLWQRTVTYDIPQVPIKPIDPPPASTIITVGWTLATAIMLLFAVSAFTHPTTANIWLGLLYAAIDIALFIYTVYNWKRVGQQRRRRTLSRTQNTTP